MKICKGCGNSFSSKVVIEGKTHLLTNRTYCLECSPFNNHKRYKNSANILNKICKVCGKDILVNGEVKRFHKRGTTCSVCSVNKHRAMIRLKALKYRGNKCILCGYDKTYHSLTYHHVTPDEKLFTISNNHAASWARIKAELDKCILVCANCHGEINAELYTNEYLLQLLEESKQYAF